MLPHLLELQPVEIHNLDPSVLAVLPLHPKLETLTLHKINLSSLLESNTIVLRALQQLELLFLFPAQIPPLLDRVTCPRLRALCAVLTFFDQTEDTDRGLETLSGHLLMKQLTTVNLILILRMRFVDNPPFSPFLGRLLSLPIHNLSVISDTHASVTSQDLELVAGAWPLLSTFKLEQQREAYQRPCTPPSRPSLTSVLTLVLACPKLRIFKIELIQDVSADELATIEETLRPFNIEQPRQTSLEYLELVSECCERQVAISEPERLARLLRSAFPRLRDLRAPRVRQTFDAEPTLPRDAGVGTDYSRLRDLLQEMAREP